MALEILNQYKGLFADASVQQVVAATITDAAEIMTDELSGLEPRIIQCIQTGIQVLVPSSDVRFVTEISPAEASAGGCIATPETYTVLDGTSVIFSAVPAVGFVFDHWEKDGVTLQGGLPIADLPAVTVIEVTAGTPATAYVTYTAVFTATP